MLTPKAFASNMIIQTIGKVVAIGFGFLIISLLARVLGQHGFGEYTTVATYLQLYGVVVDFGLTLTFLVMLSEPGADEPRIAGNFLGLRLVSGLVLFGLAPVIVLLFPYSTEVKWGVLVGSLGYLAMAGANMLVGIFQKHGAMWRTSVAELINRFVLLGGVIVLALFGVKTALLYVAATTFANIVWFVVLLVFSRPIVHVVPRFEMAIWKEALSKSWPIALSIVFNLIYLRGDVMILSLLKTPSEVGLYGAAYRIIDVLTVAPTIFMGLLLPGLVADWKQHKLDEFRLHIKQGFNVFMLLMVPIAVGAQVVSTPLMVLVGGSAFAASGPVLKLLIAAMIPVSIGALYGHAVVAIEKQKTMILGYALAAILSVIAYLVVIPPFGMQGAAWVTIGSEILIATLTFVVVTKQTKAYPNLTVMLKTLLSSAVMYGALVVCQALPVIVSIAIGGIVYILCILATKAIKISTLRELLPNNNKHLP